MNKTDVLSEILLAMCNNKDNEDVFNTLNKLFNSIVKKWEIK